MNNWFYFIYALYTSHLRLIDSLVMSTLSVDSSSAKTHLIINTRFAIEGTPHFNAPGWLLLLYGLSVDLWIIITIRFLMKKYKND